MVIFTLTNALTGVLVAVHRLDVDTFEVDWADNEAGNGSES